MGDSGNKGMDENAIDDEGTDCNVTSKSRGRCHVEQQDGEKNYIKAEEPSDGERNPAHDRSKTTEGEPGGGKTEENETKPQKKDDDGKRLEKSTREGPRFGREGEKNAKRWWERR